MRNHPHNAPRVWLVAAACGLAAAGCVTERPARRAGFRPPPPVELPPGPIAAPAPASATTSSHVQVQVIPLGAVRYDGQVLPLVSPDGRFLAVQEREPPTWPTLLAEMSAQPPVNTRLVAYDLGAAPARRIEWPAPLPPALMLGRSADGRGFLVESARPDGSRWIGRVSWLGGSVEWLAQGEGVNAHGVLTARGGLLFTRRERLADRADLVLRAADGATVSRAPHDGTYSFPMAAGDEGVAYVFRRGEGETVIEAVRVLTDPGRPARFGSLLAEGVVSRSGEAVAAYQASAPVQGPALAGREGGAEPSFAPLVLFHPQFGRMALFDTRTGGFALLAPRSIAAVRWDVGGSPGYLCTTPEGLVFVPAPPMPGEGERPTTGREVRVLSRPYVARVTSDPERPVILLGPAGRDPQLLEVLVMRPAGGAGAAPGAGDGDGAGE